MDVKHISQVGQTPGSHDCGFFAAYVISQLDRSGHLHFGMTETFVYQKRNEYRSPTK